MKSEEDLGTALMRLKEFFRPHLKCERIGHRPVVMTRRGYRYPCKAGYRFGVADSITQESSRCTRCAALLEPWNTVLEQPLDALTMNGDAWDKLKADGELF